MTGLGFYGAVRHAQRADWNRVIADADSKRSAVEVVLDDWRLAPLLAEREPRRVVVIRQSFDEKASDQHPDAAAWVRHVVSAGYDPRCYLEIENEPGVPKADAEGRGIWLAWHAGWLLDAMTEAERLGVKLAIGNWSTGVPEPGDWARYYAPVLHRIADGPHVLAAHVYYARTPDHPMTRAMLANVDALLAVEPRLAAKTILTETGKDHVTQVPDSAAGWATDESQEQHAARMLAMYEEWRKRGIYGAAEYLWIERFDQNQERWRKFNIAGADTYNRLIAGFNYGEWIKPMPGTDETLYAAKLRILSASGSRLRAAPDTSAGIVTVLAQGTYDAVCGNRQTGGGYSWAHVTVNGLTGWVALETTDGNMTTLAVITPTDPKPLPGPEPQPEPEPTPDPEPEPPVEEPPAPVVDGLELMRNLREMLQTCQQAIGVMLEYIEQEMDAA
jgi:hypothetical protein